MLDIEDDLFSNFGNTLNYQVTRRPKEDNKSFNISEEKYLKEIRKELISVIGYEWMEESELSNNIIRLDTPSITIKCQLNRGPFDTLYNPAVGVNIMSALFMQDYVEDVPLSPTTKCLKSFSRHVIPSFGILYALPIIINGIQVRLCFYVLISESLMF